MRPLLAVVFLAAAGLCAFGFQSTNAQPENLAWRFLYGTLGIMCFIMAGSLVLPKPPRQ